MDFFERFEWAIPQSFAYALEYCRFEEGDILYADAVVYETDWGTARGDERRRIQVRGPARRPSRAGEDESGRFETNWISRAKIDVCYGGSGQTPQSMVTTQGRIYTALWTGDMSVLNLQASEPPMPLRVRDVTKRIPSAKVPLSRSSPQIEAFVMARDLANEVSRAKCRALENAFHAHLASQPGLFSPKSAGISGWRGVAPTVDVVAFLLADIPPPEIEAVVKRTVYVPAKSGKVDRFRLNAHGVIWKWT